MKLHSISLKNFKSFRDETAIPLGQITYLIGPNGAGKSNVLSGLKTLSAIITGDDYEPRPEDYFDNKAREMKLAAVVELSDVERQVIAARIKTRAAALSRGDIGDWLFRRLKYEVSFSGPSKFYTISLTLTNADYHTIISVRRDNGYSAARRRSIEMIDVGGKSLPKLEPCDARPPATFLEQIDKSLAVRLKGFFSVIMYTTTQRSIPDSTPVQESRGITPDGDNILNELNDLPREKQLEFDKFLADITDESILGVEPRVRDSELILEATEPGLRRKSPHTDLGSGQRQLVLLALQLFARPGNIFTLTEPELHLHARAQKRVHVGLRDASANLQIVVETHSPIFLGARPGECVILVTKDEGRSRITEIAPDNVGLIRRELGITHADALSPPNILFAEGRSDLVAFSPFLKAVAPEHALSTMIYSLDGAHNTKNLKMLIKYLWAEGRRMFVILDENDEARRQVEELEGSGLLASNCHFLEKSLEDEFSSELIVEAVREMAAEAGCDFALTAGKLDAARGRGKDVATVVKDAWDESKCGPLSKVELAERMVRRSGGEVPSGIRKALRAAVAHFECGNNDGGKTPSLSGGAGKGGAGSV